MRVLAALASAALLLLSVGGASAADPAPINGTAPKPSTVLPLETLVTVIEDRGTISASGVAAPDATLLRSFRLSTTRKTPLPLSFQSSDLVSADGAVLDRRTVRVKDSVALGALPQDYLIEISGLKRSGRFLGKIEVRSTAVPNVSQSIPIEVNVDRSIAVGIAAQTPRFALKRATSCDPVMKVLGFGNLCISNYQVALSGSADTLKVSAASLLLVRPDGSAVASEPPATDASAVPASDNDSWVSVANEGSRITLAVPDKALDPGHYVGRVRVAFGDRAESLDIPVEIDVRWKPWWPLAILILGILVGRWQAYMQRTGNSLIDSTDRLTIIRARAERLPDSLAAGRTAVTEVAAEIWRLVELGQAESAAAKAGLLDRCVDVLERVGALKPSRDDPALKAKMDAIVLDVAALEPDAAAKKLVELKDLMAQSGGGSASRMAIDSAEIWRKVRTVAVLTASRPVQYVVLLFLLAGAGMKLLYFDGGATLGAEPLVDLLALLTWGLSADVMSRTISSASPAAAK